ncbi:hypothetical protein ACXZ1M_24415 [Duganella sp. PWIR1]
MSDESGSTEYKAAKKRIFVLDTLGHENFAKDAYDVTESIYKGVQLTKNYVIREYQCDWKSVHLIIKVSDPIARSKNPLTPSFRKFYIDVKMFAVNGRTAGGYEDDTDLDRAVCILLEASQLSHTNRTKHYGNFNASIEGNNNSIWLLIEKIWIILKETFDHFIECYPQDLAIVEQHELLPPSENPPIRIARNRL